MSARFRPRPLTIAAAVAAFAVVAYLTLNPGWIVGPLRGEFVGRLFDATGGRGVGMDLEQLLNTALFVPLGAAVAALVPWRWGLAGIPVGLAVSTCVEILQGAIPGRVSDPDDVLWNTAGAALGAVVVFVVRASTAGMRALAHRPRI